MTHSEGEEKLKREELPSPVTTPGSLLIEDEEKFLVAIASRVHPKKEAGQLRKHVPYAILSVSFLEVCYDF